MPAPIHERRKRALYSDEIRARIEAKEAETTWSPLLIFGTDDQAQAFFGERFGGEQVADDEPPFHHAQSLMDTEYHEWLLVEHSLEWSGGLRFTVHNGEQEIKFMLSTRQVDELNRACDVWHRGRTEDWLNDRRSQA